MQNFFTSLYFEHLDKTKYNVALITLAIEQNPFKLECLKLFVLYE